MSIYYAGFNTTELFSNNGNITFKVESFTKVPLPGISDIQIGWSYFLLWRKEELYISKISKENANNTDSFTRSIQIPGKTLDSCKLAAPGRDNIVLLSKDNEIWQYKMYENSWKKVINFISNNSDSENEYPVKIVQGGCTVALTNLGRAYNVPTLVHMPKRVKFIDISCGSDHTLLLADDGNIYTMGMGTRGQLGHSDLEDCDNPRLVQALAGIKVVQISASGWHSAVVTDQGDLYTWGWNTHGQLGLLDHRSRVVAVPTLVDFIDEQNEAIEIFVKKAECGSNFTVCMTENGTLWGCGSNKYGQLGHLRKKLRKFVKFSEFVKLDVPINHTNITDFKCNEWGTVLITD